MKDSSPDLKAPRKACNDKPTSRQRREEKTKQTLARIVDAPDETRIDVYVVAALCGSGATTVWNKSRKGLLPKPARYGGSTRWTLGDVRRYLASGANS